VVTLLLVAITLVTRALGPTDLWDQTQPRTVAYTADILAIGGEAWILPRDAEGLGATKPPLYNWLAAPFVHLLGRDSEFAHKLPSMLGLIALAALLVRIGEPIRLGAGWLAAIMCIASYPFFKLGTLARPDMLLVLWLTLAWWAGTRALLDAATERGADQPPHANSSSARSRSVLWAFLFWSATVAAAWTKGPVAFLPLIHVGLVAWLVLGRPATLRALRLACFGLPALAIMLAWPLGVWILDPAHLSEQLLDKELLGRVAGTGPEGGGGGLLGIVLGLPKMPGYFTVRFAPWSIVALIAIWFAWPRAATRVSSSGPGSSDGLRLLASGAVWVVLVLLVFSASSGKRADYVAPAFPLAALLASWWLLTQGPERGRHRQVWLVVASAALIVGALGVLNSTHSPLRGSGAEAMDELVARARAEARASDTPVRAIRMIAEQLPALVGSGRPSDSRQDRVTAELEAGAGLLLFYDQRLLDPPLRDALEQARRERRLETLWSVSIATKPDEDLQKREILCVRVRQRGALNSP